MIAAWTSSVAGPSCGQLVRERDRGAAGLEGPVVVEVVLVGEARGGVGRRGVGLGAEGHRGGLALVDRVAGQRRRRRHVVHAHRGRGIAQPAVLVDHGGADLDVVVAVRGQPGGDATGWRGGGVGAAADVVRAVVAEVVRVADAGGDVGRRGVGDGRVGDLRGRPSVTGPLLASVPVGATLLTVTVVLACAPPSLSITTAGRRPCRCRGQRPGSTAAKADAVA